MMMVVVMVMVMVMMMMMMMMTMMMTKQFAWTYLEFHVPSWHAMLECPAWFARITAHPHGMHASHQ
jgi:hypothetical protein